MIGIETLEDFYETRLQTVPHNLKKDIGHFNVLNLKDLATCKTLPIPYNRRTFFKIALIKGKNKAHFSDQTFAIEKQALMFASPQIPYNWEKEDLTQEGYSCVFTPSFFHHFGNLKSYSVFQPGGTPVIELADDQAQQVQNIFEEMISEWNSGNPHRFDRMRILVFELLHMAIRILPATSASEIHPSASQKIATQFLELLEGQFPVDDQENPLRLRTASDFADALAIHINHLNKALREALRKPTSALIQERVLLEAKILLKHSHKDISEIAYALGFKEPTHFNSFFKKHLQMTPTQFRLT